MGSRTAAIVLADSFCQTRLTTMLLIYPRIILPEVNTHCMVPKNSASSRAIPVERRIEAVWDDEFFVPRYLGANKRGMQADAKLDEHRAQRVETIWRASAVAAANTAAVLAGLGLHKQLANRVLEPYVYVSSLLSFTEPGNLLNLRVHKDAQDEFFELADCMVEAYARSKPKALKPGEWHVPFGDRMPEGQVDSYGKLMISAARCARLSYETHDGDFSLEKDLELADSLMASGHMSPFQHQAQAVSPSEFWFGREHYPEETGRVLQENNALWDGVDVWWAQFRWWRMFRKTLKGENREAFSVPELRQRAEGIKHQRFGPIGGAL